MQYINVNSTSLKENFELRDDEKLLADISFSTQTRFARIVSKMGKRMFSFEKKGLLKPGQIFRNEYGVKMGRIEEIKPGAGKGIVELNGKKYFFVFDKDHSGELKLYDELKKQNLLTCSFKAMNLGISKTKSLLDTKFASLLLLLCWYNFQPHSNSNTAYLLKDADLILK